MFQVFFDLKRVKLNLEDITLKNLHGMGEPDLWYDIRRSIFGVES